MKQYIEESDINDEHLWSFQDILNVDDEKFTNLEDIIYNILICNAGNKISVEEDSRFVNISYGENNRRINIPLPVLSADGNTASNNDQLVSFLTENKLDFYNYIVIPKQRFNEF